MNKRLLPRRPPPWLFPFLAIVFLLYKHYSTSFLRFDYNRNNVENNHHDWSITTNSNAEALYNAAVALLRCLPLMIGLGIHWAAMQLYFRN
mmetsp:Transcript_16238/g.21252  ORF Transcript_16238/g.21252 Transcript_16238/m.21252 type:complete len:91 (-) Transcript_16238:197-469(-)